MKISLMCCGYSQRVFFVIYDNRKCYKLDTAISKYFGLSVEQYRERLLNTGIPCEIDKSGEVYLKQTLTNEQMIELFKKEFSTELTIIKMNAIRG